MKTRHILIATALLAGVFSCSKVVTYKDELPDRFVNEGAPVIDSVFDIQDGKLERKLTEGSLAQIIHIKGKNLAKPEKIAFNGIEADLDKCYCENEDSYVVIPRVLPSDVSNTIEYVTKEGRTSFDFTVNIPQLVLTGLSNEFAAAGSSVKVEGDFFDLFGFGVEGSAASVKIGDTPVQVDSVSETYMSIVIPEDTPDNSIITFSWEDVTLGAQTKKIPYRNTSYLFFGNFDTAGFWSEDLKAKHLTDGSASGDPVSQGYRFLRFNGTFGGWSWNSVGLGDGWYYDTPADWATNWVFKLEVWTNPAIPIPAYDAHASSPNGVFVQLNLKENTPLDFGGSAINTGGQWKTFSFPLGEIVSEMPANGDYWGFAFTIQPPSDWTVDCAFANFRIEPANY